MVNYKQMYDSGASGADLSAIKARLSSDDTSLSWEDYYWGAKCVCSYDDGDFDPALLSRIINNALKNGLSYRTNKEAYLDAIKVLAGAYSQLTQYELVVNCLGAVIELDSNAPDWVFHDFVTAQNRTDSIKRNLRRPGMFLEDLERNDANSDETKKKQTNIFKEFLAAGILYLSKNPKADVALDQLQVAADLFGLSNSQEWKTFVEASKGKIRKEIQERITPDISPFSMETESRNKIENKEREKKQPAVTPGARPLIISLFPEDEETVQEDEMEKKYSELLERLNTTERELEKKTKELEKKSQELDQRSLELETVGGTIAELSRANESLQTSVSKYMSDMADYENEMAAKEAEISDIQQRLSKAQSGSAEKKELEKQIQHALKQQEEIETQYLIVKKSLTESEEKLKLADEQLAMRIQENKDLKDELDTLKEQNKKPLTGNKAAEVMGRYSSYMFITTGCLAKWLSKNLSGYSDWWENCVMSVLSYDQALHAAENHYSSLEEFDLAALLRVLKRNWSKLGKRKFMPHSSKTCLDQMFSVRNRWAHFKTTPPSKDALVADLSVISDFLSFLDCDRGTQKEITKFAVEVGQMSF